MKYRKAIALLGSASLVCALGSALGSAMAEDKDKTKPEAPKTNLPDVEISLNETTDKSADESGELAKVEQDLAAVMDELVSARARAGVLARSLFHTELTVSVNRHADDQNIGHVVLRLDGVPVHDSDGQALLQRNAQLFTGFVTPGRHELAIELVEAGKEDSSYGYTRSERYRIEVKKDRKTRVELVLSDDSDMAEEAAEGDEGEYQVETTLRIHSERAPD